MKKPTPLQILRGASAILAGDVRDIGYELVTGMADDETEDRATCPECGKLHHPSYHEDEICDKCADEMCEQVPCEILGCGKTASEAQMRTFRLGDAPVKCCPECWDAMEIPRDCRDTANLSQHNAKHIHPEKTSQDHE